MAAEALGGGAAVVAARLEAAGRAPAAADLRALHLRSVPLASRFALDPWLAIQGPPADPMDVVGVAFEPPSPGGEREAVVAVIQLRAGVGVAGRFVYPVSIPAPQRSDSGGHEEEEEEDEESEGDALREAVTGALLQHYSSASGGAPDDAAAAPLGSPPAQLLLPCPLPPRSPLRALLEPSSSDHLPVRVRQAASSGPDAALLSLATENAAAELSHAAERQGFEAAGLEGLRELLGLATPVRRVEGFDVAHLQGDSPVSSHVVFLDGAPARERYRTVPVRPRAPGDDVEAMEQAVLARFSRPKATLPDVLMVDGGKAQLAAAARALERAGVERGRVALCSLAKRQEEVFVPGRAEPLDARAGDPGVLLLRAVRDEAHRVANAAHGRLRRGKLMEEEEAA